MLLSEKPFHAAAFVMSKWLPVSVLAISLLCTNCLAGDLCVLGGVSAQGLLLLVRPIRLSDCLPASLIAWPPVSVRLTGVVHCFDRL